MPIRHCLFALLVAAAPVSATLAGTVIESRSSSQGEQKLYVSGDQVRMEAEGADKPVTLFDGSRQRLILLDTSAQQYNVIDEAQLEELGQRVEQVREQLRKQIESMPAEQQERARQRMNEMMGTGEPPEVRIERTDEQTQVNGISCRRANVRLDGELAHRLCIAQPQDLGLADDSYRTLQDLFAFFSRMTAALGRSRGEFDARAMQQAMQELGGVPIRSEDIDSGQTWSLQRTTQTDIPDERFRIPEDYVEVSGLGGGDQG